MAYDMRISAWVSDVCSSDLLRHVAALARPQHLFGEAEALDLVEIQPHLVRRDVVRRGADDGLVAGVGRTVEREPGLAVLQVYRALHRLDLPRCRRVHFGIKTHRYASAEPPVRSAWCHLRVPDQPGYPA